MFGNGWFKKSGKSREMSQIRKFLNNEFHDVICWDVHDQHPRGLRLLLYTHRNVCESWWLSGAWLLRPTPAGFVSCKQPARFPGLSFGRNPLGWTAPGRLLPTSHTGAGWAPRSRPCAIATAKKGKTYLKRKYSRVEYWWGDYTVSKKWTMLGWLLTTLFAPPGNTHCSCSGFPQR